MPSQPATFPETPFLVLRDLRKRYGGDTVALQGVSLEVARGEIVCLVGPSGCGKTTLLRCIAGLETPDSGAIMLEGKDLLSQPVYTRGFGLMFQEFALFPDKSVAQNVAFGLRMQGENGSQRTPDKQEIAARVDEMLALVNLRGYGNRSIFALSGGERQRVALARSLAPRPRLLMLDEPLGSLDRALRETLMDEVRGILKRLGLTAIYVTHDQQEALAVADRVVIMNQGNIVQIGVPRQIWQAPANAFVARFLGFQNLLDAKVEEKEGDEMSLHAAATEIGAIPVAQTRPTGTYTLLIRPDAACFGISSDLPQWRARVQEASFRGAFQRVELTVPGTNGTVQLVFHAPPNMPLAVDEEIHFSLNPEGCVLIPAI